VTELTKPHHIGKCFAIFDTGGYAMDSSLADLIKEGILQMCSQLKPEAVAVADSLAPPDFVLNSVIGKSDGKVCTVETL
jgi:acyl-CoA oxidase